MAKILATLENRKTSEPSPLVLRPLAVGPCVLGLLAVWCVFAQAQSVLNFPRLPPQSELTGIALFNPNFGAVAMEFTAYGADGAVLTGPGIRNPVRVSIPSQGQFSTVTADLFGRAPSAPDGGWFRGTSVSSGIDGFFLALDPATTFLDGAELSESSLRILFSEVRVGPDFHTELNLVNPNPASAQVTLRLRAAELSMEKDLELAAMGAARLDAAEFFGIAALQQSVVVTADSDRPIAGFELVRGPGDAFGLNARPAPGDRRSLNFPQFAALGPFSTELQVTNTSLQETQLEISAFQPDGSLHAGAGVGQNPVRRALAAGGTLSEDLAEMFGFTGPGPVQGWLRVDSPAPGVEGALAYALPSLGSLAAVADAREARRRSIFAYIATTQDFFTGVAIANASTAVANVRLAAVQPNGETLGSAALALGPGQRVSRLITELIPESVGRAGGLIWIESDIPVRSTALFGSETSGVLANVPSQSVAEFYLPPDLQARVRTTPEISALTPGGVREFASAGLGPNPIWRVNGIAGGNPRLGMITDLGEYRAPAAPPPEPVVVSAQSAGQVSGAVVDLLPAASPIAQLGVLESIAYSNAERRLYAAELITPIGGAGQESGSQILDITNGGRRLVIFFSSEEIPDMLVHRRNDRDRLLVAARARGGVIRMDPDTLEMRTIATGLDAVRTLRLDPLTGDLLLADATGLIRVPAVRVTQGLPGAPPATGPARVTLVQTPNCAGIAVDQCGGNIYYSDAVAGTLVEYDRISGATRVAVEGLDQPQRILALYRKGLPCPDSLHLLVVESGTDRVRLVVPSSDGEPTRWLRIPQLTGIVAAGASGSLDLESILTTGFPGGLNGTVFQTTPPPVYLTAPDPSP